MREAGPSSRLGAARGAALVVLAVLLATVDTRAFGLIPDGQEMLSASAAISRFFEIGVSRDFVNAPRRPGGDAVSRYGMWLSIAATIRLFQPLDRIAAWVLAPYLAWVSFAAALNFAVWRLNP